MFNFINKFFPSIYSKLYFLYKNFTEKNKIKILKTFLKKPSVILDIGSNIGFYSSIFLRTNHKNTVYSFEPDKDNYIQLRKNLQKYESPNLITENLAVGNKTEKIKLYKSPIMNVDHQTYDSGENRQFELVRCTKLDDYFPKNTKIDFIKIDTQGYDYYAIQGCKRIINDNPSIKILGELWPFGLSKSGSSAIEYLSFLKNIGFTIKIEDKNFDINSKRCNEKKYYTDFIAIHQ